MLQKTMECKLKWYEGHLKREEAAREAAADQLRHQLQQAQAARDELQKQLAQTEAEFRLALQVTWQQQSLVGS